MKNPPVIGDFQEYIPISPLIFPHLPWLYMQLIYFQMVRNYVRIPRQGGEHSKKVIECVFSYSYGPLPVVSTYNIL
jgi:hypothetical protein